MNERKEALFRVLVSIITGIILWLWSYLAGFLALLHWVIVLITNKRNRTIADFIEYYNTELYKFSRYISGVRNERPFPFTDAERMSKFK